MKSRSHTGIIMFIQNASIIWFNRRHNPVDAATFVRKLVVPGSFKDMIFALRYKLRMFGVILDGPVYILCDSRGVVKNMIIPESVIHKKHNAINYHSVCETVSEDII